MTMILDGTAGVTFPVAAATGSALQASSGRVLQVVSTAKTDTFTTTSAMPTFVDITGLSASITPTSSTSKILVTVTGVISNAGANYGSSVNLVRDSTSIAIGDSRGSSTRCFAGGQTASTANTINVTVCFLDSPATTSATTYKVQLSSESGGTALIGGAYRSDIAQVVSTASIITLQEIAA
jgi:hypothetical protein